MDLVRVKKLYAKRRIVFLRIWDSNGPTQILDHNHFAGKFSTPTLIDHQLMCSLVFPEDLS